MRDDREVESVQLLASQTQQPAAQGTPRAEIAWTSVLVGLLSLFGIAYATPQWTNGDFWISAITSTRKLTFYYWGQNRLANVVPALAFPVQDPFGNAYLQLFINGVGLVGALAIAQRCMIRSHEGPVRFAGRTFAKPIPADPERHAATFHPVVLLLTFVLWIGISRRDVLYTFGYEQPYGTSLSLYLAGSILLLSRRPIWVVVLGVPLLVASLVVVPPTLLFGGFVVPLAILMNRWRSLPWFVGGNIIALAASVKASNTFGLQSASDLYTKFELEGARTSWHAAASTIWHTFRPWPLAITTVVSGIIVVASWRRLTMATRTVVLLSPVFAIAWTMVFALNSWVEMNDFSYRYFAPAYLSVLVMILVALMSIGDAALRYLDGFRMLLPRLAVGALSVLLISTIILWKPLDQYASMKAVAEQVAFARKEGIRFIGGTYWKTWPAVLALDESGSEVFGFAERGIAMAYEINVTADEMLKKDDPVRLMCIDLDAVWCESAFEATTGRGWTTTNMNNTSPLVLEVIPTT